MASKIADVPPTEPLCPPPEDPLPLRYSLKVPQQPATDFKNYSGGETPTQSVNYVPQQGVDPTPRQGVAFTPHGVTYVPEAGTTDSAMGGAYVLQGVVYQYDGPQVVTPSTQRIPKIDQPYDNLEIAAIVAVLCCFIFGIMAIRKSLKSMKLWELGDAVGAQEAARQSRKLSNIGIVVGGVVAIILVIFLGFLIGYLI